jgi:electron transport complex protein RnfC
MLQKAILGYEANPDKRSYEMGTIVQNVATINAIANAVFEGEPLISRVTTLNGDDVKQPKNLLVKIGTPISDILNANGIKDTGQVVVGGVMMGNALQSFDAPLTKRTSSIIVFSKAKAKQKKSTACIRCARCISACPARLQPSLLYEAINKGNFEKAEKLWAKDCIACGTCSYVCPAGLPLTSTIRSIKG